MDFADILNKWEKQNAVNKVYDKDVTLLNDKGGGRNSSAAQRRYRLLRKKPDARIDLHGLTSDEAWTALENFFETSRNMGFEKILIIHGKGNHLTHGNEGVVKDLSRRFIEACSFAGESGYSSAREGGTGSTWVILKKS